MKEIILILTVHWIADFILQTNEMAIHKSKSIFFLSFHVVIYTLALVPLAVLIGLKGTDVVYWFLLNGALHWITDFFTSKLTAYLWVKEKRHSFFVAIGFDQLLHTIILLTTYNWIV